MGAHSCLSDAASSRRRARTHAEAVGGEELAGLVLGRWDVGEALGAREGAVSCVEVSAAHCFRRVCMCVRNVL